MDDRMNRQAAGLSWFLDSIVVAMVGALAGGLAGFLSSLPSGFAMWVALICAVGGGVIAVVTFAMGTLAYYLLAPRIRTRGLTISLVILVSSAVAGSATWGALYSADSLSRIGLTAGAVAAGSLGALLLLHVNRRRGEHR